MGAAVCADQSGAVDGKAHRQVLDCDIVHNLIIGALQEGGINRAKWPHSLRSQSGGKGHAMLFGYADVKCAVRMCLREFVHAGAAGHGSGNGHNPWVSIGQFRQRFAKDILIGRWTATGAFILLAGNDIEFDHAMIFVRRRLGRGIAMAFFGNHMDQYRSFGIVADIFQNGDQLIQIMPVNWTHIIKTQFFKQGSAHRHAARKFFGTFSGAVNAARQFGGQLAGEFAQAQIFAGGYQPRQIGGQAPHRRRNRHVIVVQDDDQPVARRLRVVHRLIGHASRHRSITDDGNGFARFARNLVRHSKTQSRRNGR